MAENMETDFDDDDSDVITLDNEEGVKIKVRVWGHAEYNGKIYAGVEPVESEDPDSGLIIYEIMEDPRDVSNAIFIPVVDDNIAAKIYEKLS